MSKQRRKLLCLHICLIFLIIQTIVGTKVESPPTNHSIPLSSPDGADEKETVKREVLTLAVPNFDEDELNYKFLYRAWEKLHGHRYGETESSHHRFHHREERIDGTTKGQYRFELPSGKIQVVSYKQAGEEYHAKVNYLPADENTNPCLGLGKECKENDANIDIENFDLDYDYSENEGKYGTPVHASEMYIDNGISDDNYESSESQPTYSPTTTPHYKHPEITAQYSTEKPHLSATTETSYSLYKNIDADSGLMYGINNQVAINYNYGIPIYGYGSKPEVGGLVYTASNNISEVKEKPYFDPVAQVIPLNPIVSGVTSQGHPEYFIPGDNHQQASKEWPMDNYDSASKPSFYYHDDIPSYNTYTQPKPSQPMNKINAIHPPPERIPFVSSFQNRQPKRLQSNNVHSFEYHQQLQSFPQNFPTPPPPFQKSQLNQPFVNIVRPFESPLTSHPLHNNEIVPTTFKPPYVPIFVERPEGPVDPHFFSLPSFSKQSEKDLPTQFKDSSYSSTTDEVVYGRVRPPPVYQSQSESIQTPIRYSESNEPPVYQPTQSRPIHQTNSRLRPSGPIRPIVSQFDYPPLFRYPAPISKTNRHNQNPNSFPFNDEFRISESILSSFSAIPPPPSKHFVRRKPFITTPQPIKFTTHDAISDSFKREVETQKLNFDFTPIIGPGKLSSKINHPLSSIVKSSTNFSPIVARPPNGAVSNPSHSIKDDRRFTFLDSGDSNINSLLLSLYNGPQFASSPFTGFKSDFNQRNSFKNPSDIFSPDSSSLSESIDESPGFQSTFKIFPSIDSIELNPLPQYPPLGNGNFRTSVIRFPGSDSIPVTQEELFKTSLNVKREIDSEMLDDIFKETENRRRVRSKPKSGKRPIYRKFCPQCIKNSYTRQYIWPNDELRNSGAYMKLIRVQPSYKAPYDYFKHRADDDTSFSYPSYGKEDKTSNHPLLKNLYVKNSNIS